MTDAGVVNDPSYFAIQVVDDQTGRGVPLIELRTVNEIRWQTDSAGWVSFNEPGLMNREVFFHVEGPGYEYPKDGDKFIWPKLYELYGGNNTSVPENDIKDRLLFRQVIESIKCLDEGVLRTVADGNVGSILGIGAPPWTGGFIQFVNTYGLERFAKRCGELAKRYGDRFKAPSLLKKKIKAGETFH